MVVLVHTYGHRHHCTHIHIRGTAIIGDNTTVNAGRNACKDIAPAPISVYAIDASASSRIASYAAASPSLSSGTAALVPTGAAHATGEPRHATDTASKSSTGATGATSAVSASAIAGNTFKS